MHFRYTSGAGSHTVSTAQVAAARGRGSKATQSAAASAPTGRAGHAQGRRTNAAPRIQHSQAHPPAGIAIGCFRLAQRQSQELLAAQHAWQLRRS